MSELSHDTADDGFHEIQLSGKQLVFLFIVTTTVLVVVFLCGVQVGRGARAAQGEDARSDGRGRDGRTAPVPSRWPASGPPAGRAARARGRNARRARAITNVCKGDRRAVES